MFCLLAVLISLLPLFLFEGFCILAGWGIPAQGLDPFVGFAGIQPLFVKDATETNYVTAENRLRLFAREEFPIQKASGVKRVFCLGGSTVQGEPYSIQTAFPQWLELALNTADETSTWEVVNCGGLSYASYRLVPILNEVLQYQPDLIILCTGHNEFLEDRSYPELKSVPAWSYGPISWLAQRRTTVLLSHLFPKRAAAGQQARNTVLPLETEAMLDFQNGTAAYHWDPQWHRGVVEHYRYNLHKMIELCEASGVPVVVLKPCSNLAHNPPFKSEHRADLTEQEQASWQQEIDAARMFYGSNLEQAIAHLQKALSIDPQYALTWYELGQALAADGKVDSARDAFLQARDLDVCPLRMTSALEQAWNGVVAETGVPSLDLHRLFEDRVPGEILGDQWLVDHIHPNFEGHQLIATTLVPVLAEMDLLTLTADWEEQASRDFQKHFESLDRSYFHKGKRKLESLRGWATGRADGPPVETKYPHRLKQEDVRVDEQSRRE